MRADQLTQLITQLLFVLVFIRVAYEAWRHPRRTNIDITLLFGVLALLVAEGWVAESVGGTPPALVNDIVSTLLMALPYLLYRLVQDFADPPRLLTRAAVGGLAASTIGLLVLPQPLAGVVVLLYVVYFFGLTTYVAVAFVRAARRSSGVTRRRMQMVAAGSLALAGVIVFAGMQAAAPGQKVLWQALSNMAALASGLGYVLGFAPPRWLRRTWQEPELRAFLGRAASLPRLPTTDAITDALASGAAHALGTDHATVGLWLEETDMLRFRLDGNSYEIPPDQFIVGRAFRTQTPIFSADNIRENPSQTSMYEQYGSHAILAAPITAGERRLGVLAVYSAHAPVFADDDLSLVTLLADQAAVILESRALIDEATSVRAREEAARLKDDFLSAAAHDLRTPLTTMIAQGQLLAQRARRNPGAPADGEGLDRLVREGKRLKRLVQDLLDVTRLEGNQLVGPREEVDLTALAADACTRYQSAQHPCVLEAPEALIGYYDHSRILQLFDNLLENAVKYSPDGGEIGVTLAREGEMAHLQVADRGIGIPSTDLPYIADRFYRGANVVTQHYVGLGLGLSICRGIAEQHGGRLWATSAGLGAGSTFHVLLPLGAAPADAGPASRIEEMERAASQA